ncbi:MAG: NAD(P)/FAD-dependent oxidoreductase [Steroidobacteraceae bacterium]
MSRHDADVIIIGAGPAGSSIAIRLAQAGWRAVVVEQSPFPRHKVCGECLGPASLELLDELGIGERLRDTAGPEIRRVGWMTRSHTIIADMPPCSAGRHRYGFAIGRDLLDALLLERARELGVRVIQPARVREIRGAPGAYTCNYLYTCEQQLRSTGERHLLCNTDETIASAIVVDAHGSWERGPAADGADEAGPERARQRPSDLFAFKASFQNATLSPGLLAILSFPGGYGGMVVADRGRTTVACCIQRDALRAWRADARGKPAGAVIDARLRRICRGVAASLEGARRENGWYAVGPLRTGFHVYSANGLLPVGNSGMEAHPLIGEGMCIALQSAALLAQLLGSKCERFDGCRYRAVQQRYANACRARFARRLYLAQLYAQVAMCRPIAASATAVMRAWPRALTRAARLAGKANPGAPVPRQR